MRNSRSYEENETAGFATMGGAEPARPDAPVASGSGGAATRSVVVTFQPLSESRSTDPLPGSDSTGLRAGLLMAPRMADRATLRPNYLVQGGFLGRLGRQARPCRGSLDLDQYRRPTVDGTMIF